MSDSTTAHVDAMVARVKSYTSPTTGSTLARLAAGRVYGFQSPPAAAFPHVVLRKINAVDDTQIVGRENFDIEVMCHHRPRVKEEDCEAIADLVEQALMTWRESGASVGLTVTQQKRRERLPYVDQGADAEIVTVRLLIASFSFPKLISAALN